MSNVSFSKSLKEKITQCESHPLNLKIGPICLKNKLIMAPMAAISNAPFRLLMQNLGAAFCVSELISGSGIIHRNQKTIDMLRPLEAEENLGIQLFGDSAAEIITSINFIHQNFRSVLFIDLNMGCPVQKVVKKGAGAALLIDIKKLEEFLKVITENSPLPISIKIRTGWDLDSLNANEVASLAKKFNILYVAIHGRTRSQKYTGQSNWEYIEDVAKDAGLPIIGNGDLFTSQIIKERLEKTNCTGLMIARGAIRNPFIFLESLCEFDVFFNNQDYLEVILNLYRLNDIYFTNDRIKLIQLKKHIVWFAQGLRNAAHFREIVFNTFEMKDLLMETEKFFLGTNERKMINYQSPFMMSGHG